MLRSRESHELERVLFPCNRLLQPITRAISILRRVVLPHFLEFQGIAIARAKIARTLIPHIARIYVTRYILYYILS